MPLDKSHISGLCRLARLQLSPDEHRRLVPQLDQIVSYFDRLQAIDTARVRLSIGRVGGKRGDVAEPSLTQQEALAGAPQTDGRFFLVPKVLD